VSQQPPNLDLQEAWQICRGLSWNESRWCRGSAAVG